MRLHSLNVETDKLDALTVGCERNALVSEHHNPCGNEQRRDDVFHVHGTSLLQWPSPGNDVHEDHDDSNNQQDVDKGSHRVAGDKAQQPEYDQDDCNGV